MKPSISLTANRLRRSVLAAVVLGTALSALGTSSAAAATPEHTLRAVNDISRYCTVCWRNARLHPDCWTDCTQDVFARLMERVQPGAWDQVLAADSEERREFIRAIDAVKKRSQRGRKWGALAEDRAVDSRAGAERARASERQSVDAAAAELLSPRQQRILQMSFEGWSVHEIAAELTVPAERVSDEKYKAIRKLRDHLVAEEQG